MSYGYYFAYSSLAVLLTAFIPAMVAASKDRSFSKWYLYSVLLLPIAFIHSLAVNKPLHVLCVYTHDKKDPMKRKKKTYRAVTKEEKKIFVSPRIVLLVFCSKLIFGALVAIVIFALFRTFVYYTKSLAWACAVFAVLFSSMLAVAEICQLSRLPMMADEITKRAFTIFLMSVTVSLPFYVLQKLVFENVLSANYASFTMLLCTMLSFLLFLFLLTRKQRIYYSIFNNFFDYCIASMLAYAIFTAASLIWMSISNVRNFVYLVSMPMQLFNMDYFSGYMSTFSSIYSAAFVHLVFEVIILFSGLLCQNFKRKELERRVEYRAKAFRLSRKPILRRHIALRNSADYSPMPLLQVR